MSEHRVAKIVQKKNVALLIVLALFVVAGTIFLMSSRAAPPFIIAEPENGTVTSPATQLTDSTASGSSAVKFAAGTQTGACTLKPGPATVGAILGPLTQRPAGDITLTSGQTLENVKFDGGITIRGNNVTVRNVYAARGLYILNSTNVLVEYFTADDSMAISSSQGVTFRYANLGTPTEDATHVTSDSGSMNQDITFAYNYFHDPNVQPDAHFDGTQVRGVQRMSITCSVYRMGPYQNMWNANIYLEDANGGNSDVTVANNWLYDGAFAVMLGPGSNFKLLNNRLGGDIHWDYCYIDTSASFPGFVSTGNVRDDTGAPVNLCL